ncbi:MAG: Na/Pi cotransporter family protein [Lachnospiraceae bacterium]|nr:Na/Pi cotransporter family protein [Lachnospiraceae bacterium]
MGISNIISLFGSLGLFLFGMKYMGDGLELAAGPKMKDLLETLTRNRVMGFLLGALVTIVIQSSSATTVMVMGFINAGIMDLAQATGVILGANIGTTITSVLIALDVSGIAPVCICLGAVLMLYTKKKRTGYVGQVILGFGLLFQGLSSMSAAMSPLKDSPVFLNFIANATNPVIGFVVGVILCAILQSSSAAVGVIQALAMQGLMPLHFAAFIICGINVGSSTPPILSAINARNNAKRAALIYLIFNVVGAIIFVPLTLLLPITSWIEAVVPSAMFQVSLYHILFKVVTGLILLPLTDLVVKWTYRIIPKQAHEDAFRLEYIDKNMQVASPAVVTLQVGREVERMGRLARENLVRAKTIVTNQNMTGIKELRDTEDVIDYLASEITEYLTTINAAEMPASVSRYMSSAFHAINDLERIADHAVVITGQTETNVEAGEPYSEPAQQDLLEIFDLDLQLYDITMGLFSRHSITPEDWVEIRKREHRITKKISRAQAGHMERLKAGQCSFEKGLTFVEILDSFGRIAAHSVNIAEESGPEVLGGMLKTENN